MDLLDRFVDAVHFMHEYISGVSDCVIVFDFGQANVTTIIITLMPLVILVETPNAIVCIDMDGIYYSEPAASEIAR
jgi:hypothetical protein